MRWKSAAQRFMIVVTAIGYGYTGVAQTKVLDSIKAQINKHPKRDTFRVRLITDYARAALNGNTSQLLPYLNEVISISKEQNYLKGLQAAYNYKQIYYSDKEDAENASAYADTAFMLLKKDTSKFARTTLAWLHNNVAGDYAKLADYQRAIDHLTKAAIIFEKTDPDALASVYGNIAIMCAQLLLPERAMEYDRRAIAAAEKAGDSLNFARRNIGYVSRLLDAQNFREAAKILDKIEPIVIRLDNNAAYIFFYQNRGLVSKHEKQYEKAISNLKNAYAYALQNDNRQLELTILDPLSAVLTESGKLKEAKQYLDTLLAKSLAFKIRNAELTAYGNLAQWHIENKDYKKANEFLLKKISLSDSLSSEEMKKNIAVMETRFKVQGKDNEIQILRDEKKIQQLSIRQKNILNYVLFGGSTALIVILVLGYRNYKNRQKLQQQRITELETQQQLTATEAVLKGESQERTRLAKDLHDGLGGMLSGIKYSLNTMKGNLIMTPENAQAFERSIDMLDSSIQEMRRVAHNMMPEALVKFGLDTALKDFCLHISQSGALGVSYQSIGFNSIQLEQTIAVTIYRIVQELINNTIKHAAAKNAIVQLSVTGQTLSITVEDDGKGFDTSTLHQSAGIGWSNIKNRINFLNGKLDIQSVHGKGTSVLIELPLANNMG